MMNRGGKWAGSPFRESAHFIIILLIYVSLDILLLFHVLIVMYSIFCASLLSLVFLLFPRSFLLIMFLFFSYYRLHLHCIHCIDKFNFMLYIFIIWYTLYIKFLKEGCYMPKYQYLGQGPVTTRKSKDGTKEYLQRCVYLAPVRADGSGTASAVNVYLMGDRVNALDDMGAKPADFVFADFNHKGWLDDIRKIPDPV